jgi:hypothetical protein
VVLGELGNFPSWGVDLGHCVGGFWGVMQFSFMGIDLVHCVGGFRWFWGS